MSRDPNAPGRNRLPRARTGRPELDQRGLLQRAAQDDPLLAGNYVLSEDELLHCVHCDFVSRQPSNARAHIRIRHALTAQETEKPAKRKSGSKTTTKPAGDPPAGDESRKEK